jgi:hypothetical protein
MQDAGDDTPLQRPDAPKQAIDSPEDDAAEQPNPGDPGPPVLRPTPTGDAPTESIPKR